MISSSNQDNRTIAKLASHREINIGELFWRWGAVISSAGLIALTLPWGFGFDHGFVQTVAWSALQGRQLYVEIWDTTFPGAILLQMAVIAIGGPSPLALRTFDWLMQIGSLYLIYSITRRYANAPAAALATVLYSITYISSGYYHTAQRDGFLTPFMLGGVLAAWDYILKRSAASAAYFGALFGIVCLIRPTYAIVAGSLGIYLLVVSSMQGRSFVRSLLDLTLAGLLCALPVILFIVLYALIGELETLANLLAYLSTIYTHLERSSTRDVLLVALRYPPNILLVGATLFIFSPTLRQRPQYFGALLVLLAACIIVRVVESKIYQYQFIPIYGVMSILAGIGLTDSLTWLTSRFRLLGTRAGWAIAGLLAMAVVAWPLFEVRHVLREAAGFGTSLAQSVQEMRHADTPAYRKILASSQDKAELARYLREHTASDDTILLWGPEPGLLYAAGRLSASRFIDTKWLLCEERRYFEDCPPSEIHSLQARWKSEFLRDVKTRQPVYIVARYQNGTLAMEEGAAFAPDFPDLRRLIGEGYRLETEMGSWSIFRRRET